MSTRPFASQLFCNVAVIVLMLMGTASQPACADVPASNRRTARFEINFMKSMIDHHNMAVEMADLCVDRAIHEKLEELCHEMITAQT